MGGLWASGGESGGSELGFKRWIDRLMMDCVFKLGLKYRFGLNNRLFFRKKESLIKKCLISNFPAD